MNYDDMVYTHIINLYDNNLTLLESKEESFDERSKNVKFLNLVVDNDGSVYIRKVVSSSDQYIVSYDANKNYEKWEEKIDISRLDRKAVLTSVNFKITSQNELVVVGYYTHDGDMDGCFFMKIDRHSKEIVGSKVNEFSKEFKNKFIETRTGMFGGKEKGFQDVFKELNIINKDDGGVIVIGEVYSHSEMYNRQGVKYGDSFFAGDIILFNLSSAGDLIWANKIPKNQLHMSSMFESVGGEGHISSLAILDSQNLYMIFNDDLRNLAIKDTEVAKPFIKYVKSTPMVVSINLQTGQKSKKVFTQGPNKDVFLKPSTFYQEHQGADAFIFYKYKSNYKFGKVKISS